MPQVCYTAIYKKNEIVEYMVNTYKKCKNFVINTQRKILKYVHVLL